MKHFAVYDKDTGKIKRVGTCPDSMFDIQAHPSQNEGVVECEVDHKDSTHCVCPITKQIKPLSKEKLKEKEGARREGKKLMDKERLIQQKINEILRDKAVNELIKEGKL